MNTRLSDERTPTRLALLVGSNPLPNYLAAAVLGPRETVILLHSPETQESRDHLSAALKEKWPSLEIDPKCIDDATDRRKVHDVCSRLKVDHLHYSGGTKTMAAHARHSLQLGDNQASYLDERKGLLRFDDGYDVPLGDRDVGLSFDILLRLHGIERRANRPEAEGGPAECDVEAVARSVRTEPGLARRLYEAFRQDGKMVPLASAKAASWNPEQHGLVLGVRSVPEVNWSKARYESWARFLTGDWLERWTAAAIRSCLVGVAPPEVGVKCSRTQSRLEFEIDVALVRGHRLYVVSCTTDTRKDLCKSKLFELAMRARQMGGDLARSALVCLSGAGDALRADMTSVWDAPNVPRVFGIADLREWAGDSGPPNTSSLKEWLDT
ncbi:MAG: DUF1887 family protein [Deltaproteobacteria bacterium]|nr:DUF1887 family protein [Deltaproteobacteria bacterium]